MNAQSEEDLHHSPQQSKAMIHCSSIVVPQIKPTIQHRTTDSLLSERMWHYTH